MLSAIEMLLPLIAVVLVVGPLGLMFAGKLNVKNDGADCLVLWCIPGYGFIPGKSVHSIS